MTDLDAMEDMLKRAGFEYRVQPISSLRYRDGRETTINGRVLCVTGHFYDELEIVFDAEGGLLDMSSHVMYGNPSCRAARDWLAASMDAPE